MGFRAVCGAMAATAGALFVMAPPAVAGAPNYDCVAGEHARITIDQWGGVVAVSGPAAGPTRWADLADVRQNGPSLDITFKLGADSWHAAVRGMGTSFVVTRPEGKLTGHCRFIPGNYVLRASDAGGAVLRAEASRSAKRLLPIPVGTAVWETPDQHAAWNAGSRRFPALVKGEWYVVRTYVARAGALKYFAGWLRQREPSPR
jgi:hypothetical protein